MVELRVSVTGVVVLLVVDVEVVVVVLVVDVLVVGMLVVDVVVVGVLVVEVLYSSIFSPRPVINSSKIFSDSFIALPSSFDAKIIRCKFLKYLSFFCSAVLGSFVANA